MSRSSVPCSSALFDATCALLSTRDTRGYTRLVSNVNRREAGNGSAIGSGARRLHVRRIGWHRRRVPVQIAIEPVDLPLQALDEVPGLTGAGQVVVLPWKEHDLARHAEVLERAEPLLALLDRHAEVAVGMKNQGRRPNVFRVRERRVVPVEIVVLEDVAAEIIGVAVGAVPRAVVADEIRDAAQRDGRLEPRRVADDPVGHVAAVAAAGDAEPLG